MRAMGSLHYELARKMFDVDEIRYGLLTTCMLCERCTATYYNCSPQELLAMLTIQIDGRKILHADCAAFAVLFDMMNHHPSAHGLTFPLFVTDKSRMTQAQHERVIALRGKVRPYEGRRIETWYHSCIAVTRVGPVLAGQHRYQWLARWSSEQKNMFIGMTSDAGIIVGTLHFWLARQGENATVSGVW